MRDLREARTFLFVPGSRPDRFARAADSGAEQVILDLEDAVEPDVKDSAREAVCAWLASGGQGIVRVNAASTPWFREDCEAIAGAAGLAGVMLPKSEDPAVIAELARLLGPARPVVALVETALGIRDADAIAAAIGVARIAFGSVDFSTDIGCSHTREPLLLARSTLVRASRAAGIAAPVDGVTTDLDDETAAADDARYARTLGFRGKLCIHPRQLAPVVAAFRPTDGEVAWATRVVDAASDGSAQRVDGQMVDRPVLDRARQMLADSSDPTDKETP